MIDCSLSRFTAWPGTPTAKRQRGTFQVDYLRMLEDLSDELRAIGGKNVEMGLDVPETKLRTARRSFDGWPKADTVPATPGVILRFDRGEKPMQFACDRYLIWQHNLRAIGLTLEALRAVQRYGATQRNEQYRGYERQIAAKKPETGKAARERAAAETICRIAGLADVAGTVDVMLIDRDTFGAVFRQASANLVKIGGQDNEALRALNTEADILKARHRQ